MKRYLGKFLLMINLLGFGGCGHPSADMMFNTSTEAYPVVTEATSSALADLGMSGSGVPVSSVVRIELAAINDSKMKSVWAEALVLQAKEGDLRFVQLAKCYIQPKSNPSAQPVFLGQAKAEHLSEDRRSLKFDVDHNPDLAAILKSPFSIVIEIEGDAPSGKISVFGELTFKARVSF